MLLQRAREFTSGPIYTPVGERGTILLPSASGGTDWGGGAWDPNSNVMVASSNYIAMVVTNIPADQPATGDDASIDISGAMEFANAGSPYRTRAEPLMSPLGAPCSEPPWARLTAVDMRTKAILWQVPLGDVSELAPFPIPWELGTPGVGAPLVTAGGLVFIGYSLDDTFRAFDLSTGEVLWKARLPAPANLQPQTYWYQGRQYVVVPAGGHNMFGTEVSDAVMAYRLP